MFSQAEEPSGGAAYLYLLYGEDEFSRSEQVAALKAKMCARPGGEYNISVLDGQTASAAEVLSACDVVPFLADRRMVIATGLLGRLSGAGRSGRGRKRSEDSSDTELELFCQRYELIPPSTSLVLVEGKLDDQLTARLRSARLVVRRFDVPKGDRLVRWVRQRAKLHGVEIEDAAASALAAETEDLRRLDAELAKLAVYGNGTIGLEAVRTMVASSEASVFAMLDAAAERRSGDALAALRSFFQHGQRPEAILGQLAALVRRLLIVKELSRERGPASAAQAAAHGINPNTLPKLQRQARNFQAEELERAMVGLLEADRALKTGQLEPELAVELALAAMSPPQPVSRGQ